jgi:hypothetical protein
MQLLLNKRIFVVEDHSENRIITRLALSPHGAKVEFEYWGRDTVRRLRTFAPVDVVLLDLMLGQGVTGYDLFRKIRAEAAFANVPIAAVSASDPAVAIPKCRELGFTGFIAKPIDDELFPEQVAKIIRHEPVWYPGGPASRSF